MAISSVQATDVKPELLPAIAHEHGEGGFHGKKRALKHMARYLGLSDEQIDQIKEIKAQAKTDREASKSTMVMFGEQVKALMENEEFDESSFLALHSEYQSSLTQAALQRAKTKHAIYQVLTEEQKLKADKIRKKKRKALML